MAIDPATGVLTWTPGDDQLGIVPATVRVIDGQGGSATQSFAITVRGEDLPPVITSTPPTMAAPGLLYSYQVRAHDPEDGPLTYLAPVVGAAMPSGIQADVTIDAAGLITWTRPHQRVASIPVGDSLTVTVQVEDDQGAIASQTYVLVVGQPSSLPPSITSQPVYGAVVGQAYQYAVTTTDPQGNPVVLSLAGVPPAGMTIVGNVVEWTPTSSATVPVTVLATDSVTGLGESDVSDHRGPGPAPDGRDDRRSDCDRRLRVRRHPPGFRPESLPADLEPVHLGRHHLAARTGDRPRFGPDHLDPEARRVRPPGELPPPGRGHRFYGLSCMTSGLST